ncbi:hypothetical protein [Anthocerotibacter panamensis]|uniref:hypothetical protein n=1 Tax=Anthocerotibacter panamensis TaxID=2857077 RepID=UPI001C4016FD|nr:hypothetical protein [Anthocerotibacter panamensis]
MIPSPHAFTTTYPQKCLAYSSTWKVALKIHGIEWFQTRSSEGVTHVSQQLQELKAGAKSVSAQMLHDPSTQLIQPDRTWRDLDLDTLRSNLGLEQVLNGGKVKRINYQDRYLRAEGGNLLARLLLGDWLSPATTVHVYTLEAQGSGASQQKSNLTQAFSLLEQHVRSIDVKVQPHNQPRHVPHQRKLEVFKEDGKQYTVIFDKGMDFVRPQGKDHFEVSEPTYVVIDVIETGQ